MQSITSCRALVLVVLASCPSLSAQSVQISEIFHHPASTNVLEQYVELYNPGGTPVDISGWKFVNGVRFTFPAATTIAAGGYLAVAADAATFTQKHPGVINFVAGWLAPLEGHTLELDDNTGAVVQSLTFATEGDWAERRIGAPTYGHAGWEWYAEHDGLGKSLELINPSLPGALAQNWASSVTPGGTPGRPNSVSQSNIAPIISEISHFPIVPQSTDLVTISARVLDEQTEGVAVTLRWRIDSLTSSNTPFASVAMADDGGHGDGLASDGIYGAILPAQTPGTVVEFFIQASDKEGNQRAYPQFTPPSDSFRTANLLYQVDIPNFAYGGAQPFYRLIMTEIERLELYRLGRKCPDSDSDASMNATFITEDAVLSGGTTTQLRYNVDVRNRGHGTRQSNPNNYHVSIPDDRLWKKQSGINFNSQFAHAQVLGSAVFRKLGVAMADSRAVQLRVNGTNLMATVAGANSFGSYAANEQYNNDFIKRSFPADPGGNSYRGVRDGVICDASFNGVADLAWHGAEPFIAAYTNAYYKQNNFIQKDWSDLIHLIGVLNQIPGYSTPETYVDEVRRTVNVEEWMRYMAVNTLLDNQETCLANGVGDDYGLYRGQTDPRFLALPYDLDSLMGNGSSVNSPKDGLFRMNALPAMERLMKTPQFAQLYFQTLKELADSAFSPAQMNVFLDQVLGSWVPQLTVDKFKAFNASHVAYVLSQIPTGLTVSSDLPVSSGFPRSTVGAISLNGQANVLKTQKVLVNGVAANFTAWQGVWTNSNVTLHPGINRVTVQALDAAGTEVERTSYSVWYDDANTVSAPATISGSNFWSAANGPYVVAASLTINAGATLRIEAGSSVYLGSGANLTVADGGRLLAEGTIAAPIQFTRAPGASTSWGGIVINGSATSPETRIAYAHIDFNGTTAIHSTRGTLVLDHLTFGNTAKQYVSLDDSSFVVSYCTFPTPTAAFELMHGNGSIKAGGRGIIYRCFYGIPNGYNDVVDFTGGNRPTGPIIHFIDNVFIGASDDILDLDGTDAWVEGNIFLHVHKNGTPDTASAVSGGNNDFGTSGGGLQTSQVTILGNLFFDCDQMATAKQGNFFTLINNTMVRQTHQGGLDSTGAIVNLSDVGTTEGVGMYLEGNIIYDAEALTRGVTSAQITFTNNLMALPWSGPGGNNSAADPMLTHIPTIAETQFTSWEQAQILREWLSVKPGSPALRTGPNRTDRGGIKPLGVSISGEPEGTNNLSSATLTVGVVRTGNGIPAAGFPEGSGYTHYKWRLDGGAWSPETPINTPINLNGLANGSHSVEAIGKRDTGVYQDYSEFGVDAVVSHSKTWVVDTTFIPPKTPKIQISEVLAKNGSILTNAGTQPDLIELRNVGNTSVDLSGLGLTDSAATPYKYTFPNGTTLAAGAYLVLFADNGKGGSYAHTGFSLKQSGDDLSLFDKTSAGGALIDSVTFGMQLPDISSGRRTDGSWGPCRPTFGGPNEALGEGDPYRLKINEWLTDAQFIANNDFVELYNPDSSIINLGGYHLSDAAGAPQRHRIENLTFIGGRGFASFIADGNTSQGPDHLNFKLSPDVGLILLSDPELQLIDAIAYGPQRTDVSQGRSPSGGDTLTTFAQGSPGGPNPGPAGVVNITNIVSQTRTLLSVTNTTWRYDNSGTDQGSAWRAPGFVDTAWSTGKGLFGFETTPAIYPYPFNTTVPAPDQAQGHVTVYFRAHFQWTNPFTSFELISTNYLDDGAVFYLNGNEAGRLRVTANPVLYASPAQSQGNEGQPETLQFGADKLVPGDNVIAVELHQVNAQSSDTVFGMSLTASQSVTNVTTVTFGVAISLNEILADNVSMPNPDGTVTDWVELYNATTNAVDLSGMSLSTDPSQPRRWVFPVGSMIPSHGYFTVSCNGNAPASDINTGFGLSAQGDSLYLFNQLAAGGEMIDGITFGLQTPNFAVGRVPDGVGTWALTVPKRSDKNVAAGLASPTSLKVNEWMAAPASGNDWFEIVNTASLPVALGGLYLTDNLSDKTQSPIAPLSFIGTEGYGFVRFYADGAAGADHVKFSLKQSGESLGIFSGSGLMLDGINFGAQATGVSQGRLPDGSATLVSFPESSSPEESNYLPLADVVINELLAHTDPPLEDAVELFNTSASPVSIGGWYLSNAKTALKSYRIPDGTTLPAHGFKVIYETSFNQGPTAFTFNSAHGDMAILSQADGQGKLSGYRAEIRFGASANGVSFGRVATSVGTDFTALSARTFGVDSPATVEQFRTGSGAVNATPLVGPVVVSEIHYHPLPDAANGMIEDPNEEFIELHNLSSSETLLYDSLYPTNTWHLEQAVSFRFPEGSRLGAGAYALIVNFSPTNILQLQAFRSKFSVADAVQVYGPWSGKLSNTGDRVELYKPDPVQLPPHPDAGFVPAVLADRVNYAPSAPWPSADGNGLSLHRQDGFAYGNEPANWTAAAPTAGRGDSVPVLDTDHDGIPDAWETANGLDPQNPNDAGLDPDGDGLSNLQEYLAGTNPRDGSSALRLVASLQNGQLQLSFQGVAGKAYTLQYLTSVADSGWTLLAEVPTLAQSQPVHLVDPSGITSESRFYRLLLK